jgi:HSP20 family protein
MRFLFWIKKRSIKRGVQKKEKEWLSSDQEGELAIDAYETDNELVIQSPIAGITPKDLEISVDDDMLIIKGKRVRPETVDKTKKYFYQECFWGRFSKKLILPEEIDITKAKASIKNGVFTLRIPKKKKRNKKEIKIEVEGK